jgi:two-component sensor histidine kinase
MKQFAKLLAIVFGVWTLIAVCGGLSDYLFLYAVGETPSFWHVLRRPLTEQWIWAALTPIVFLVAQRFPLRRPDLLAALAVHATCFLALSFLHSVIAAAVDGPLGSIPAHYHGSLLKLRFLEELYSDIWMYWPLVCIQALLDSHARARERDRIASELETELTKARLGLLRAQIHPHFLFNTLHSIAALTRFDVRAAEEMVADLSELLRASFADPTAQETTLRTELELVRCYMRIQSRRFSDRLSVNYRIEDDTLDAAVPVLVLQSLVENAVIHGISPSERPGTIAICASREDERLVLRVEDDGVGLRGSHRPGVGLSNASKRLRQLYGEHHSVALAARAGGGVVASVSIPWRILPLVRSEGIASHENTNADRGRRGSGTAQPVVSVGS